MPRPRANEIRQVLFDGEKQYLPTKVYQRTDIVPGCTIEGPARLSRWTPLDHPT
jgi:hypothetical protein